MDNLLQKAHKTKLFDAAPKQYSALKEVFAHNPEEEEYEWTCVKVRSLFHPYLWVKWDYARTISTISGMKTVKRIRKHFSKKR